MLSQHHLNLGSVRLKSADEWSHKREGLSFLIVKQGAGKVVCGSSARKVGRGDVLVLKGGGPGKVCVENGGEVELSGFTLSMEQLFPLFGANEMSRLGELSERFEG